MTRAIFLINIFFDKINNLIRQNYRCVTWEVGLFEFSNVQDIACGKRCALEESRPRGYKMFFILNLTEHEISTARKH